MRPENPPAAGRVHAGHYRREKVEHDLRRRYAEDRGADPHVVDRNAGNAQGVGGQGRQPCPACRMHARRQGRLLAHVAPSDEPEERRAMGRRVRATFNVDMVENGWPTAFILSPNIPSELDLPMFHDAVRTAVAEGRGAWADPDLVWLDHPLLRRHDQCQAPPPARLTPGSPGRPAVRVARRRPQGGGRVEPDPGIAPKKVGTAFGPSPSARLPACTNGYRPPQRSGYPGRPSQPHSA